MPAIQHDHLLDAALLLIGQPGRPRDANLRRAISTIYYALFHCLAGSNADLLIGGTGAARSGPAWTQTYRALQHGTVRRRCDDRQRIRLFPRGIRLFAQVFCALHTLREEADYNPTASFYTHEVHQWWYYADVAIRSFIRVRSKDRRAFAAYVLLQHRQTK